MTDFHVATPESHSSGSVCTSLGLASRILQGSTVDYGSNHIMARDGANEVYYIGIIDFLIPWDSKKKAEYAWNCARGRGTSASCVPPVFSRVLIALLPNLSLVLPKSCG